MAKGARVSILAHRFYSDADAKETFGTVWRTKTLHGTVVTLHKKGGITVKWDGDEVPYKFLLLLGLLRRRLLRRRSRLAGLRLHLLLPLLLLFLLLDHVLAGLVAMPAGSPMDQEVRGIIPAAEIASRYAV